MKSIPTLLIFLTVSVTILRANSNSVSETSEPFYTEKKIIELSDNWHRKMMTLSKYQNLKAFCSDDQYRQLVFELLDDIHRYHDILEIELQTTQYNHSKRTIQRILKHMDKLDEKFKPADFTLFFREQCMLQSQIEKNANHYKAGFGTHSYGGKVYTQEVEMYRYLKRLTRRISSIESHVSHFYMKRKVWEH